MGGFVDPPESILSSIPRLLHWSVGAAIAWSVLCGAALAASNTVYRCTSATGKVTLSDRRCPDDDVQAKAQKTEPSKPAASAVQPKETSLDAKQCEALKLKIDEGRKNPPATDAKRKALRQSETDHQQRCAS